MNLIHRKRSPFPKGEGENSFFSKVLFAYFFSKEKVSQSVAFCLNVAQTVSVQDVA